MPVFEVQIMETTYSKIKVEAKDISDAYSKARNMKDEWLLVKRECGYFAEKVR